MKFWFQAEMADFEEEKKQWQSFKMEFKNMFTLLSWIQSE